MVDIHNKLFKDVNLDIRKLCWTFYYFLYIKQFLNESKKIKEKFKLTIKCSSDFFVGELFLHLRMKHKDVIVSQY